MRSSTGSYTINLTCPSCDSDIYATVHWENYLGRTFHEVDVERDECTPECREDSFFKAMASEEEPPEREPTEDELFL